MKKIFSHIFVAGLSLLGVILISGFPSQTFASSSRPTCTLIATVDSVAARVRSGDTIYVRAGAELGIDWDSLHTTTMRDQSARVLPVSGHATTTIQSRTRLVYRFTSGSTAVTCSVTVYPVSGSVTSATVASSSHPVTFKGTTRGVSSIIISVTPVGVTITPTSTVVSVPLATRRTAWSYTMPKALPDGQYQVEVATIIRNNRTIIATSTLAVGPIISGPVAGATTVVVVPVPLLIGGKAHPSATVAVAYLQLINVGYATTTVRSISLTQYGNAPTASVVGLTSITDNGAAKGSIGTMLTGTPFTGNTVVVPLGAVLAPREMRLVTIKAVTTSNILPYVGTTLTLWVSGVATDANLSSKLPLYGTTWTFGY